MTFESGQMLSRYRLVEQIGEGGMGVVWKAVDPSLEREIAVKILPDVFSSDPDRLARFEREAKVLASLRHPCIATVHGLEEAEGVRFLAMELAPGEDLAKRIARGPVPVEEALPIALQIAEALEAAHESGVVHRDLKPANIQVDADGRVKVLDFGLAKAFDPEGPSGDASASLSPTLTAAGTAAGIILGTAAYMAPEQAKGKKVDRRADVWAFGVVVYEMLTGRQPFRAENISETLAAVILKEPDLEVLPAATQAGLRRLLARCLTREPMNRLRDIGEARIALRRILDGPEEEPVGAPAAAPPVRRTALWAGAVLLLAAGIAAGYLLGRGEPPAGIVQATVEPPAGESFHLAGSTPGPAVVSPDGTKVAFSSSDADGDVRLFVRPLGAAAAYVLTGTEGAQYPFWSPDSRFLGFFTQADRSLKRIEASGGLPVVVCEAPDGKGGSWGEDGVILFAPSSDTPIHRVAASGGESQPVTELTVDASFNSHRHPRFLPDGRHFLYVARVTGGGTDNAILMGSLDGAKAKEILRSPAQVEYADGYLLFLRGQTLLAQPFDAGALDLTGEPVPIARDILTLGGAAQGAFSASRNVLVYQTGGGRSHVSLDLWERDGTHVGTLGEPGAYREVRFSPDGTMAAVTLAEQENHDVWIFDLARGVRTRFTYDSADDINPVWTPGGESLLFASNRAGKYDIYRKTVGGTGAEEIVLQSEADKFPSDVSPDGSLLTYTQGNDVWLYPLSGKEEPAALMETPFLEAWGMFSPDGRWLAFLSNESGDFEIYAAALPGAGRKWQISSVHGGYPLWRDDGREIIYQDYSGQIHGVEVDIRENTLVVGRSVPLIRATSPEPLGPFFSVTRDHRRFLTVSAQEVTADDVLTLVLGWQQKLQD